jgi:hypothetical protein
MKRAQPGRGNGASQSEPSEPIELPAATTLPATQMGELTPAELAIDQQTVLRVEHLPREAGWMLVTAGVVGLIVPGMLGTPFLFAGVFVLVPGGPRLLSRWASRNPPKFVHTAMRQIGRFLDDLERRYPAKPSSLR